VRPQEPDLRLAAFAIAVWLAALAALFLPARAGLLLGGAAIAAAGVAGWRRWAGRLRWVLLALLLGVGCGAFTTAVQVAVREAGPLVALLRAGDPVRLEAVVRDDPRALRGSPGRPTTYLVSIDLRLVRADDAAPIRLAARAVVLGSDPAWRRLLPGQRVAARGRLLPPRGGDLRAAVVSVRGAPTLLGRPPWTQRAAGVLRAGLQRACAPLPDDSGGLLPGLVVGDTSRLDPVLEEDFRTTGMTHLNAVSGTNVG
jgi:competence protein ComEC